MDSHGSLRMGYYPFLGPLLTIFSLSYIYFFLDFYMIQRMVSLESFYSLEARINP
jgi:uncharacterized metal-binding protein